MRTLATLAVLGAGCDRAPPRPPPPAGASPRAPAVDAPDPGPRLLGLAVGREHACTWTRSGALVCWGNNRLGEVHAAMRSGHCRPLEIPGLAGVRTAAAAERYACAVADRGVTCVGDHPSRRADDRLGPRVQLDLEAVELVAAPEHACARTAEGRVWCWGRSDVVGPRDEGPAARPRPVPGLADTTALATGPDLACATAEGRSLTCWGAIAGLLPSPPPGVVRFDPQPLAGPVVVASPTISEGIPCALDGAGHPWCWTPRGSWGSQSTAQAHDVGLAGATRLFPAPSGREGCALAPDDAGAPLRCWGLLDDPPRSSAEVAAALRIPTLPDGVGIRDLALVSTRDARDDELAGCLLRDDDGVMCWLADGQQPWEDELAALSRGRWATDPHAACRGIDRDDDGRPDESDRCPDEAEVYNGQIDDDGCPDQPPSLVRVDERGGRIELRAKVKFEIGHDRVAPESRELLDHLAAAILGHPRLARIEVQVHTDDHGQDAYGRRPTQRRAERICDHLISLGVERDRLQARGYGESQPIASNRTKEGRALNRRVEIVIRDWSD